MIVFCKIGLLVFLGKVCRIYGGLEYDFTFTMKPRGGYYGGGGLLSVFRLQVALLKRVTNPPGFCAAAHDGIVRIPPRIGNGKIDRFLDSSERVT